MVGFDTWSAASATLHGYCSAVDEGRVDDFVALYMPDGIHDDGIRLRCGHAEIAALVAGVVARYTATSHHLSNIMLEPAQDGTLSARSHIYAWHRRAGHPDLEVWGQYRDILHRHDGRWLFVRRMLYVAGTRGLDGDAGFRPVPRLSQSAR